MCNLYTTKAGSSDIAAAFNSRLPADTNVTSGEVYPGGPGFVVREQDGERVIQAMTWRFPLAQGH